ncbi:hypothetical protein JCM8547_005429 [Rhodosporidiobolus lusitaniae]
MPPPAPTPFRQRVFPLLPLLVFAALLALVLSQQAGNDYSESSVHAADVSEPPRSFSMQDWTGDVRSKSSDVHLDEVGTRKARVGLAGAGRVQQNGQKIVKAQDGDDDLAFTVQQPHPRLPLRRPSSSSPSDKLRYTHKSLLWPSLRAHTDRLITRLGDLVLSLFVAYPSSWFDLDLDLDDPAASTAGLEMGAGASLAGWSESTLSVPSYEAVFASRPSSFGPHLVAEPLTGQLFPVSAVEVTDSYACGPIEGARAGELREETKEREAWIALVQRGKCPFSDKVRYAQEKGAKAVVFGDMEESEGGIGGGRGLLTPWSPDDTQDIYIPSIFVSRASYLSLLRMWDEEQQAEKEKPKMEHGETQTEETQKKVVGLDVVLSKEEQFAWPLLDLLFLLLFLPSLLTLVTVFTQRVRLARAAKAERAPKDAVARLPVFRWGDTEKGAATSSSSFPEVPRQTEEGDEERDVGSAPDESTSLLPSSPPSPPTLVQRVTACLPVSITSRLPSRFGPSSATSTPLNRRFTRPTRRFPNLVECPFCLSDFENGDIVLEMPCGHLFHAEEVESWLENQRGSCPVCRVSILAPPSSSTTTIPATTAAAPIPAPHPLPDGAVVLVNPLRVRAETAATSAPAAVPLDQPLDVVRREYAASPVASSSSVPIEGVLCGAVGEEVKEEVEQNERNEQAK